MSFPKYSRLDLVGSSFADVSFADLARYANNLTDEDISVRQCVDDLNGFGDSGPTNIGLGYQWGNHKEENYGEGGGAATRKAQCNVSLNFNSPFTWSGSYWGWNGQGVGPTLNPFGGTSGISDGDTNLKPLYTNILSNVRYWMWAEEDSNQYPSGLGNTKSDRLMLSELVSSIQVGDQLPGTWDLGDTGGSFNEQSGLNNIKISQDDIWGVPEGFGFSRFSLQHMVQGSGNYYLWLGVGYRIGDTDSPGWLNPITTTVGAWYGPFSKGTIRTQNNAPSYNNPLRDLSSFTKITGLEDNFRPDTIASGAANYANFGIETFITSLAWVL
jgi:hypothetical protein